MKRLIALILIMAVLVPAAALADGLGKYGGTPATVYGKWTLYFDAREYNKTAAYPMDFDIQAIDLYIYENGSCYFDTFEIRNGQLTNTNTVTGIWIGSDTDITMQFGELIYKANIELGSLVFHTMSSDFRMTRVYSIDPATYFSN